MVEVSHVGLGRFLCEVYVGADDGYAWISILPPPLIIWHVWPLPQSAGCDGQLEFLLEKFTSNIKTQLHHMHAALNWTVNAHHLHHRARQHPQRVSGPHRNPDDGGPGDGPTDPLSPGRKHVALIASRFELDDGEDEDDLPEEKKRRSHTGNSREAK